MRTPWLILPLLALAAAGCDPPDVEITEPPIKITTDIPGYGDPAEDGDLVKVNYVLSLPSGQEVLRQRDFRFQIGTASVISAIDDTVLGMRVGSTRTFTCPPHRHWGRQGYGGVIPPNTDLTIKLTLVDIEGRARRRVGVAE